MKQQNQTSTTEIFASIYDNNVWGGASGEFYSGKGSDIDFSRAYCDLISDFVLESRLENIKIIDLGCGDFRVGQQLLQNLDTHQTAYQYIGIDIVPKLVKNHKMKYANQQVDFLCLNVIEEDLPAGDICLIRQVLQHLSNEDIKIILTKLSQYKYVFITESHPANELTYVPNLDIETGAEIRLLHDSGVFLDQPPFNLKGVETVLTIPYEEKVCLYGKQSKLCTFKIENPS
jgi:hypothetical protein